MAIIRRLSPAHAREFKELRLAGLEDSPTSYGRSLTQEKKISPREFARKLKAEPGIWNFGAFVDGKLIGMLRLDRDEGEKEKHKAAIYGMYVAPAHRGQGIGRDLMKTALKQARKWRGVRQVRLQVVANNQRAMDLYQKFGFKEYGREEDALYVGRKFYAEVLMVLKV